MLIRGPFSDQKNAQRMKRIVEAVQDNIDKGAKPKRTSIFYELLDPHLHPDATTPTLQMMADEAFNFCVAASDTTGNAMTVAAYHVFTNAEIYRRVKRELEDCFPGPVVELSFTTLEKLTYLSAIVKEGLRYVEHVDLSQGNK